MTTKWVSAPLGDLCDISIGRTPSRAESKYWGLGNRWLSIADMNQGVDLHRTKEEITEAAVRECNCRLLAPGTLVMSFKLSVGKLGFVREPMCTNEAIAALPIRDPRRLDGRFLYRALQIAPLLKDADRAVKGLTLNSDKLARVPISYPVEVAEQCRIADILDKADAIRRKRKQAIALTEELLRSAFLDMFGDPVANPKGWEVKPLGGLVAEGDTINYGVVQPGADDPEGVLLVRVGDFDGMSIRRNGLKRISPETEAAYGRSRLRGDEVLVACVGSIGKVALADMRLAGANIARAVARVRVGDGLRREYLACLLETPWVQRHFLVETRTVSQPTLNIKQIQETPVLLPPPDKQDAFVVLFQRHLALRERQVEAQAATEDLFNATVHAAFGGKLVEATC